MHEILHFPVKVIQSKVLFVAQRLWDKEENMMSNTNDLLNRINNCYSSMSKGQKLLATYITDNYDKAVFLTARLVSVSRLLYVSQHILDIKDIRNFSVP